MAARKNRGTKDNPWDNSVRTKIKTSMLINRLSDHVLKDVELSATQVRAAEILLKKTIPDLSATELTGAIDFRKAADVTDDELANIAARGSEGASKAPIDKTQLN